MAEPIATILIVGDSHLSSENHGYHKDYPSESLYYEEEMNKLVKKYNVTHYINLGDFILKKDFSLAYRAKVDKILTERKNLIDSVGGKIVYLRGNHDITNREMSEFDYYRAKGLFETTSEYPILDFNNGDTTILHCELHDYGNLSAVQTYGKNNILLAHGFYVFNKPTGGGKLPTINPECILEEKTEWAGLDTIICGHIHTEYITSGLIAGKPCTVHYLPCLSRPSYMKDYEEGPDARKDGAVDIIKVYEDHADLSRLPVPFLSNDVCFKLEQLKNDTNVLETRIVNNGRKEALMTMAEELEKYERRETDPIKQIEQLTAEDKYKEIVKGWFGQATANLERKEVKKTEVSMNV